MNTQHYKDLLEKEVSVLETELATVGRKNPDTAGDWEATESENTDPAEDAEVAESLETLENNKGVLAQLEGRLAEVKKALGKIEAGTYGKCEVCGEAIEEDRLEANLAANTCKQHME
jgi:RNA polymerase-binding transcription factor DksA